MNADWRPMYSIYASCSYRFINSVKTIHKPGNVACKDIPKVFDFGAQVWCKSIAATSSDHLDCIT